MNRHSGAPTDDDAVGAYWFVNDNVARDLPAARLRVREVARLGFTELWIAVRALHEWDGASSPLLCPAYGEFLDTVFAEADHLGIGVVPFAIPCCLWGLEVAHFDIVACGEAAPGSDEPVDLGAAPAGVESFEVRTVAAYRVAEVPSLGEAVVRDSVRMIDASLAVSVVDGRLVVPGGRALDLEADEHLFVEAVAAGAGPCDMTAPEVAERLAEVVRFHDAAGAGHRSYIGLAFDEPNVFDGMDFTHKERRPWRFYGGPALASLLVEPWALTRPVDDTGFAARVAYIEAVETALIAAIESAMEGAAVPMLGTHDWSGDRDRGLYGTPDQLAFTKVRQWGATDISGPQWNTDYAVIEPLVAWAQKEAHGLDRAMIMTDHWREPVDHEWLRYTCERHAALGVDYMLLHTYGAITGDPPGWTSTESWPVSREPFGLDRWTARMRSLARLHDYAGTNWGALLVYPRSSRFVHTWDRHLTREWATVLYGLHRTHRTPLCITQPELRSHPLDVPLVVLPRLSAIDPDELETLAAFVEGGGTVLATSPDPVWCDAQGHADPAVGRLVRSLFNLPDAEPVVRRFEEGQDVKVGSVGASAHRLSDGTGRYDDTYLDWGGGPQIHERTSTGGGRAVLVPYSLNALSYGDDLHLPVDEDIVLALDELAGPLPRTFEVDRSGEPDHATIGLLRRRGDELAFSGHRPHEHPVTVRAGRARIHLPAGRGHHEMATGINAFVHHVEEQVDVVVNPFQDTLASVDLGREIASVSTYGGRSRWCLHEGSNLEVHLRPGDEVRYDAIVFGPRDASLPTVSGPGVVAATVPTDDPRTLSVRVTPRDRAEIVISMAASLGSDVSARCATSAADAEVTTEVEGDRLRVTVSVAMLPTIENTVVVTQR